MINYKTVAKWLLITTTLTTLYSFIYNAGYDSAKVEIQLQYNDLIENQRIKYNDELKLKFDEYNKSLIDSKIKHDNYWSDLLEKQKNDLIAEHNTKTEAVRITDATKTIEQDSVNIDALRLLQQSKRIISTPADYKKG
jgi:hypothetical protein